MQKEKWTWENKKKIITNASCFQRTSELYYKEVKNLTAVCQLKLNFCKNKEGNLLTRKDKITDRWVEYTSQNC